MTALLVVLGAVAALLVLLYVTAMALAVRNEIVESQNEYLEALAALLQAQRGLDPMLRRQARANVDACRAHLEYVRAHPREAARARQAARVWPR